MTIAWNGPDQRRFSRIDVLMRVTGRIDTLDTPIAVHNLSRNGFAVVSTLAFQPGESLDFRLFSEDGSQVSVTAEAVHTRPLGDAPGMHLSGFRFVPGRLTGVVPQVLIDRFIDTVCAVPVSYF